ncbi:MAG: penicillin-binding protein [Clostridiales bacterium]|nr:penicillin-binding protein [Clostridiales bacterium]
MSQSKRKNSLKSSVGKAKASMHQILERFPALHYIKIGLKVLGRAALTLVLIGVITGSIVVGAMVLYIFNGVDGEIDADLSKLQLSYTSFIYVNNEATGEPVEAQRLHGAQDRVWVDFEKIPQSMKDAAIAIEDQRFYQHHGVDWKRTIGAAVNSFVNIYGNRQGGSTITQQLIKNLTEDDEVSFSRKLREIKRALEFEKNYLKDDILEAYLNTIHLGSGCDGVQAAANRYFNKDVGDLNLAECASIIGITQYPTKYNPLINPDANKEKQEIVLKAMLDQGKISESEYREAVNYKLVFTGYNYTQSPTYVQGYYVDMVIEDVINDLQERLGYEYGYAERLIYNGGLKIYTAMSNKVQTAIDTVYTNQESFPANVQAAEIPQGAIMVMDYEGRILGVSGGIGVKEGNRDWNRATNSKRQVGSSMKPLSAYAPAVETNQITYSTVIPNEPITIKENGVSRKWPPNYSGVSSGGSVTVENALKRSLNTVAARIVDNLGVDFSFKFCKERFELDSLIDPTDRALSPLALGGMTEGLTVKEMTAAYQTFGNGGKYFEPYSYYRVEDNEGNVLLENNPVGRQVLGEDTAYVMNRLMTRVMTPGGTGYLGNFRSDLTIFAKTGTSGDDATSTNVWFAGGTPYYVAVSWYGYDNPKHLAKYMTGGARDGWKKVMEQIHQGMPGADFEGCDDVVARTYCEDTGLLASGSCTRRAYGYYKRSNIPPSCSGHSAVSTMTSEPTGGNTGGNTGGTGNNTNHTDHQNNGNDTDDD